MEMPWEISTHKVNKQTELRQHIQLKKIRSQSKILSTTQQTYKFVEVKYKVSTKKLISQ